MKKNNQNPDNVTHNKENQRSFYSIRKLLLLSLTFCLSLLFQGCASSDENGENEGENWLQIGKNILETVEDKKQVKYRTKISIQSSEESYLTATANGTVNVTNQKIGPEGQFTVINADRATDLGPLQYGDFLALKSADGNYLTADENDSVNANSTSIGAGAKWKVLNPLDINSRSPIDKGDPIIFRSYKNKYLIPESEGSLKASATELSEATSKKWTFIKYLSL